MGEPCLFQEAGRPGRLLAREVINVRRLQWRHDANRIFGFFWGSTMQGSKLLLSIILAVWTNLLPAGVSLAGGADLRTPEGAVATYIDGVARQDFSATIAATSVSETSKGFNFVAQVGRVLTLSPFTPAPASDPFFIEINKANFVAQIARQVQFLTYGLMTTKEILDGKTVPMDAAGAADFASAVRANRLSGLALVKVGIPKPKTLNSEIYQANAAKLAKIYGADGVTERVALVSFEGLQFMVGFTLLHYGDDWSIFRQSSDIASTNSLGAPKRVTPEAFEEMLR